jgi:quercetin dioxygenase-like cupin family protein
MKYVMVAAAALAIGILAGVAAEKSAVSYIDHETVGLKLAQGGQMVKGSNFAVSGSHRDKAGGVEVHDKETDVIYVIEGQATFVTGGAMVGGKDTGPNQHLGTGMEGGEARQLTKGDVIVVPAGTTHWFKEVPDHINYFVVKAIQP